MESPTNASDRLEMRPIPCAHCGRENPIDTFVCRSCGGCMVMAKLVSIPTPGKRRKILPLCARDYRIGVEGECDYCVPCPPGGARPEMALCLKHVSSCQFTALAMRGSTVTVNGHSLGMDQFLMDGDRIGFADGSYVFQTEKHGVGQVGASLPRLAGHFRSLLDALFAAERARDLRSVCSVAVRTVIGITGMDRGIYFRTTIVPDGGEGRVDLEPLFSWSDKTGSELSEAEARAISQTIVADALLSGGSTIIRDALLQECQTQSVVGMNLRSLVCVPLARRRIEYSPEDCLGVIYADSFMCNEQIPSDCEGLLTSLADILACRVDSWQSTGD